MGFHSEGTKWDSWKGATDNKINFHVRKVISYDVINLSPLTTIRFRHLTKFRRHALIVLNLRRACEVV